MQFQSVKSYYNVFLEERVCILQKENDKPKNKKDKYVKGYALKTFIRLNEALTQSKPIEIRGARTNLHEAAYEIISGYEKKYKKRWALSRLFYRIKGIFITTEREKVYRLYREIIEPINKTKEPEIQSSRSSVTNETASTKNKTSTQVVGEKKKAVEECDTSQEALPTELIKLLEKVFSEKEADPEDLKTVNNSLFSLSHLDLSALAQILDDKKMRTLVELENFSRVKSLNLSGCSHLTDEAFRHLGRQKKLSLRALGLSGTQITHAGIEALVPLKDSPLAHLEFLSLERCAKIGSDEVRCLRAKFLELKGLSIEVTEGLDLSAARCLTEWKLETKKIHFKLASKFRSETIFSLKTYFPCLTSLDLSGQSEVKLEDLKKLKDLENLNCLNLTGCKLLPKDLKELRSALGEKVEIICDA